LSNKFIASNQDDADESVLFFGSAVDSGYVLTGLIIHQISKPLEPTTRIRVGRQPPTASRVAKAEKLAGAVVDAGQKVVIQRLPFEFQSQTNKPRHHHPEPGREAPRQLRPTYQ
jgi:hypothetical protein